MNSVSMATNCAPFCRAQNAATASLSVIRLIAEGYTILPAAPGSPARLGRQERLGLLPQPADDLAAGPGLSSAPAWPGPALLRCTSAGSAPPPHRPTIPAAGSGLASAAACPAQACMRCTSADLAAASRIGVVRPRCTG